MRTNHGTVDDGASLIDLELQLTKNRGPVVLAGPVCESVVGAFSRPEALGQVAPRKAGFCPEQDGLDE